MKTIICHCGFPHTLLCPVLKTRVEAPNSWAYSGIGRSCIGIWCSFVVKQENQVSQVVLSLLSCHFIPYTSLGQSSDAKLITFCNYTSLCWQGFFINSLMEICTKWVDQFVEIKTCHHCYLCQRWKSCAVAKCLINKAFLQIATGQRASTRRAVEK